jgi:hypothetical protein
MGVVNSYRFSGVRLKQGDNQHARLPLIGQLRTFLLRYWDDGIPYEASTLGRPEKGTTQRRQATAQTAVKIRFWRSDVKSSNRPRS